VDTRERKPLSFPAYLAVMVDPVRRTHTTTAIRTVSQKLETADYVCLEAPEGVVIERKGSLDEISKNVLTSTGRRRFIAELERLNDCCKWPYILFEGTPATIARPTKRNPSPHLGIDALLELSLCYNVPMLLLPSGGVAARRRIGEYAARLLIRGAIQLEG
jgi:hypothetical protein